MKIFTVKSGNSVKKAGFEKPEANVNEWPVDHSNITIEHTHDLAQPNLGWSQTAFAVWHTET